MEIAIIPRFIVRKFFRDDINQIHANILISSILIIAVLIFWCSQGNYLSSVPHFCVFQKALNMPCPGCGMTRSVCSIAEGNVYLAWQYNPAGFFVFLFFIIQIPLRIIALRFCDVSEKVSLFSRIGSIVVICMFFLVWMIRLI